MIETVEQRYVFVENNHKVAVGDRLKKYNLLTTLIWDYMEQSDYSYHGVIRSWSAVFRKERYIVLHHFLDEEINRECIAPDSGIKWTAIFNPDCPEADLFMFLEKSGFQTLIPQQAMIDAMIDDGDSWHYMSPKHKFLMYCFHPDCSLLVEVFLSPSVPPYGASRDYQEYPTDRCQISFDFDLGFDDAPVKNTTRKVAEGESLDILEKVDDQLLEITAARIKKIYDEHDIIGLLHSGGKDSRLTLQLMIQHAIKYPDPNKRILVISADTLVENPGITKIINDLKTALSISMPTIEFHIVEPEEEDTLLVCIIGKGYQPPSTIFKYCVRRLKIDPARKFLETTFLKDGAENTCLILGSRDNESTTRKRSMEKHFGDDFYGHHPVGNIRTASPIRDWTAQEVVTYLTFNRAPWSRNGARNTELLTYYGSAAGNECPLGAAVVNDNEAMMQCGKSARMGCYLCTIAQDRSMGNLIQSYPEYEKYYMFRSIVKTIGQDIRFGGISGYQRIGKSKIGSGIGDLTIDCRTLILEAMKRLDIEWRRSEILTAYQMVLHREVTEGFPLTQRFQNAIYDLLNVRGAFRGYLCHSVFDPFGTGVDQVTDEDQAAIARVLARRELNL